MKATTMLDDFDRENAGTQSEGAPPKLCPCGRMPLECALDMLAVVGRLLEKAATESPECCQRIAVRATRQYEAALRRMEILGPVAHGILGGLRDDAAGRPVASHIIEDTVREVEMLRDRSARRRRRAAVLLRRKYGGDDCPACGIEPGLRKAADRLRWCAAALSAPSAQGVGRDRLGR